MGARGFVVVDARVVAGSFVAVDVAASAAPAVAAVALVAVAECLRGDCACLAPPQGSVCRNRR